MPFEERVAIIKELSVVDKVIGFDDSDDSACQAIFHTMSTNTNKIVFANGGDRTNTTTPEYATYGNHSQVEFAFGVGGEDKKNIYVLLPNGESLKATKDVVVPPGAVVVVPPKTDKLSILGLTDIISRVMGNIATSVLAINNVN